MRNLFIGLFIIMQTALYCQEDKNVSIEDLNSTHYPQDSSAAAAYLHNTCEIEYRFSSIETLLKIDYHFRIKIYKEKGERYGQFSIPFYEDSKKEDVKNIKAYTYFLNNGEMEEVKLDKDNIFIEKTSDNWRKVVFAMPNVKPGSIVDVKYTIESPYSYTIPKWYFQHEIPVKYSKYSIEVPSFFGLTPISSGVVPLEIEEKTLNHTRNRNRKIYITAREVPAIKDDEYVLNIDDYRSGIKYEIHSARWPSGQVEYFSKDWLSIGDNLLDSDYFGKELKRRIKDLDPLVDEAKLMPIEQRIPFLYEYVTTNYAWNRTIGISKDVGLKKLIEDKKGSSSDINMLLINLLSKADVAVTPLAIKQRFYGLLNVHYPSRSELNYLLAHIDLNGRTLVLDATSKYCPIGMLPLRAVNFSGLLIEKNNSRIISLENPNRYNSVTSLQFDIDIENNSLTAIGQSKRSDYAAVKYRMSLDEDEVDEDNQDVEDTDDSNDTGSETEEDEMAEDDFFEDDVLEIIEVRNAEDINKDVILKYSEIKYHAFKKIGDKIFIDADLGYGISNNPFTYEKREFPIFYNQLSDIRRIINIKLPDELEVESMPEAINVTVPGEKANFIYDCKIAGQYLSITFHLKINNDLIIPDEYGNFKYLYDLILQKQNEKIVLNMKS